MSTIKEEIHAIDEVIGELKRRRRELELKKREEFLKEAQKNVGRCFKINNTYAKVLDVPHAHYVSFHEDFNEYQYPGIFLTNEFVPFESDTVFSGYWGIGHGVEREKFEEITKEEFNAEFDKRVAEFVKKVKEV